LPGPETLAEIGDGVLGIEAPQGQLEEMYAPGRFVPVAFGSEEKTIGGTNIHAGQDRLAGLKDLIERGMTDGIERFGRVQGSSARDGLLDDVMNKTDAYRVPEEVFKDLPYASKGRVTDQDLSQHEWFDPG
jgi:hypothetical protein